jgi:hypothetical protein
VSTSVKQRKCLLKREMRITQEQINLGLVWSKANREIDTQKNRQIGLKICKYIGKEMYIV